MLVEPSGEWEGYCSHPPTGNWQAGEGWPPASRSLTSVQPQESGSPLCTLRRGSLSPWGPWLALYRDRASGGRGEVA